MKKAQIFTVGQCKVLEFAFGFLVEIGNYNYSDFKAKNEWISKLKNH